MTSGINVNYGVLASATTTRFRDTLEMFRMTQWVTEPTHRKSKHTIDLVITRDSDQLVAYSRQRGDLTSDHSATFVVLNVPRPETVPSFVTVRCINKIDKSALKSDLASAVTSAIPLTDLNDVLSLTLDKHAPHVQRRVQKHKATPWYTAVAAQLQELKRERRRAERRWLLSKLTIHKNLYETSKRWPRHPQPVSPLQCQHLSFRLPVLNSDDEQVRDTARSSLALHMQKRKVPEATATDNAFCGFQTTDEGNLTKTKRVTWRQSDWVHVNKVCVHEGVV
ncbi:hypothetical protein ACOMHN_028676 [Nucella lapillus]